MSIALIHRERERDGETHRAIRYSIVALHTAQRWLPARTHCSGRRKNTDTLERCASVVVFLYRSLALPSAALAIVVAVGACTNCALVCAVLCTPASRTGVKNLHKLLRVLLGVKRRRNVLFQENSPVSHTSPRTAPRLS